MNRLPIIEVKYMLKMLFEIFVTKSNDCAIMNVMGTYLNPDNDNFRLFTAAGMYVDKTGLIAELNKLLNNPAMNYVCVSRPRRFGKTLAGDMICAYYSKGADSEPLFSPYKISKAETFKTHLNKYNVIQIDLNAMFSKWKSIPLAKRDDNTFIGYVSDFVCAEFREQFGDIDFNGYDSIADYIQTVYKLKKETFVIIIDEYDVLVREEVPKEEFDVYLAFLNSLFKNSSLRPAISLAYITGILPIIRDKIQSKLNTFNEYTIINPGRFAEYTGFTSDEVKTLCEEHGISFEECRSWYDGYKLKKFEIYNPQAVYKAVMNEEFRSYWSATSTYNVVAEKIRMNFAGTKDDVIAMMGGGRVYVNVEKYRNYMDTFSDKDDVFTYLIHLGYLAYDENEEQCYIPNREVYNEWKNAISNNEDYAVTNKIIAGSRELLQATIEGDEKAVAAALDRSHFHVASNLSYNRESSLQSAVYLAYIYALNGYIISKEMPAGKGYADIVYIPFDKSKPAMIVELKRNSSSDTALNQIKEKRYFDTLENWHGDILFVGINYDENTKEHSCRIERFVK